MKRPYTMTIIKGKFHLFMTFETLEEAMECLIETIPDTGLPDYVNVYSAHGDKLIIERSYDHAEKINKNRTTN